MGIGLGFLRNEAGEEEGLGDAGIELFKDAPYASCAREAGQNSRDAAAALPVRMTFDLVEIATTELPLHKELVAAVDACRKGLTKEKDVDFFTVASQLLSKQTVKVLRISDSNTKGLTGPPEQSGTAFHSLLKASGVSNKDSDTSGGSFGIGKNASFAVTDLQTVFYSTVYLADDGVTEKFAAQGKVKLISHVDQAGILRRATGYWGNTEGFVALTNPQDVPVWLRRSQVGTSIFCVGFRESPHWSYRIAYSLITNFFVAIHRGEMEFVVDAGKLKINRNTLAALFDHPSICSAAAEAGHLNNLSFSAQLYRCLTNTETVQTTLAVEGLGQMCLHILMQEDMPKRVGFIRNGMLITTGLEHFGSKLERFPGSREFIALVEPISDDAGKILKTLENPAHNSFSAHRIADPDKRQTAEKAMRQLAKTLRDSIRDATGISHDDQITLDDLARYFAEPGVGDKPPNPNAEADPEKHIYKPPIRKGRSRKAAAATGVAGGRGSNNGDGGTKSGVGPGEGSGAGGSGRAGRNRRVVIEDFRNIVRSAESLSRYVFFTPDESGEIAFGLQASGVNGSEPLNIVSASSGEVKEGIVWLNVEKGTRLELHVEFDEPYFGPVEASVKTEEAETVA